MPRVDNERGSDGEEGMVGGKERGLRNGRKIEKKQDRKRVQVMDVLTYDIPVTVSQIRKTLLRKEKTGRVGKKGRRRGSERKNEKRG